MSVEELYDQFIEIARKRSMGDPLLTVRDLAQDAQMTEGYIRKVIIPKMLNNKKYCKGVKQWGMHYRVQANTWIAFKDNELIF